MSEKTTGGPVADHGDGAEFSTILVDRPEQAPRVGLITLHRPEALNALNTTLMHEVVAAATAMDADPGIGAIVLTGSRKAFAAGADIKEMRDKTYPQTYTEDLFGGWDALTRLRTPLIAAVSGYALGGGCELAMLCDVVLASDTAVFGQPEIKLGVIPGIGGSQRLTRAVGKAKAMELVLTGRNMPAEEAERCGLVARVVPVDDLLDDALATAATIASYPATAVAMAKEVVDAAFETPLAQGLQLERRVFHAVFGTPDQREGMTAFLEKRPARFHEA